MTTRWATESDGKGTTARTLTVKLPAAQWVQYVKINWEMPASGVPTPKKYTIEAAEKEGGEFKVVHTNNEQVTKAEQIIELETPVWAKELKLNVTEYGAATGSWYNVSVAEFSAYAVKPESDVIDGNATAKQIADKLAAPTVKADKTGLEWQEVPEGVTVEFLADYEQIVGRDGKIYQPLTQTKVKGIYKVTKGNETAEGATDQLKPQGSFDQIGGEINLGQKYTINQFSFTPRQGTASGQVTKADLYVKANESDEWVKVAEDKEFAADASKKTIYFDEQEVQFVKFVAKASNDGWVAVSEFDIDNEKVKEMTVYVAAQTGGKVESSAKDGKVMQHADVTVKATPNKDYEFAGWYDILTEEKVSDDAEYTFPVELNTSLIAHFTKEGETPQPKEWTVTIDGTAHKVKDGETLKVEEPSKAGHAFAGFYLVGTDTAVDFTQPITADLNVESRFTQYKVTAVESENGTITVSEMNDKGEVTVTAKANDGYIFQGWKVDGKDAAVLGTPYTFVPTKDTTVEAVYKKMEESKDYHTVIIDGKEVTVEDSSKLTRPADPVKEGYKFIGWFVGDKEFDFNTPITGDLKIEARFEKLPTTPGSNTDKNDKNDKNNKVEGAVQTGDTANVVPWIVCLGAAAGAGVVVLKSRKKRS